jgi:hypothetical protein
MHQNQLPLPPRAAPVRRLPQSNDFDPGDGRPMALRLLCLNSADGSELEG